MACWRKVVVLGVLTAVGLLGPSCKSNDSSTRRSAASQPASSPAMTTQSPMSGYIRFEYAIYYLPQPTDDPIRAIEHLVAQHFSTAKIVAELPDKPTEKCLRARLEVDVRGKYVPPDLKSLGYFGRGLTREQAEALQESKQALILDFAHPKKEVWSGIRTANAIVSRLAHEGGGLIWDEETREVFTPDSWDAKRITSWTDEVPDVSDHTVIHAYRKDEYVRAITLGMAKLGLPDVVIEDFSWSANRNMGHLINLFAQAMAEGALLPDNAAFALDLRAIKNAKVREPQVKSLKANATAIARLTLKKGKWEEGDPRNRLIEVGFDGYPGPDLHAKQEKLLGELFGWEDATTPVRHTEDLLAASRKAKEKLPALREAFQKGLAPGEFIQVKAPFRVPTGGNEWMWVEVTAWTGSEIKGLLKNEPFNIPNLHGGQEVTVLQDDVFDYIRRRADGTQEGNETGKIIERQSQTP